MNIDKKPEKKMSAKKELRQEITGKIEINLTELRKVLGDKKFDHRIKKAVKLLTGGLNKNTVQKEDDKKDAVVKTANPKKEVRKKSKSVQKTTSS